MKIVHIITSLWRGGASIMLYKLLNQFSKGRQGEHEVIVLRKNNKLELEFNSAGIPVKVLGLGKNFLAPVKLYKLQQYLEKTDPDIIHSWMYHSNFLASLLSPSNVKIVWSIHHSLENLKKEKRLTRYLIQSGSYLSDSISKNVFCSQASKKQHEEIGYTSENATVIPNGFDLSTFYKDSDKGIKFRKCLNIPLGKVVFGQAARYHPLKNQEGLIKAFAKARKRNPDIYLLLAGSEIDWNNEKLVNLISSLSISNSVSLIGECTDMPAFLNALDFYFSSSLSEAFPMVIGEAMACGIPCIATDVGDSSYIMGNNGIIVDIEAEQFVDALCEMAGMPEKEYEKISISVRKRINDKFCLSSIAERYITLYRNVVG